MQAQFPGPRDQPDPQVRLVRQAQFPARLDLQAQQGPRGLQDLLAQILPFPDLLVPRDLLAQPEPLLQWRDPRVLLVLRARPDQLGPIRPCPGLPDRLARPDPPGRRPLCRDQPDPLQLFPDLRVRPGPLAQQVRPDRLALRDQLAQLDPPGRPEP
jgi:hypothetical protein